MNSPHVRTVQGVDIAYVEIEGLGVFSRNAAIELAARIVFLADGNLILSSSNEKVLAWNVDSQFFREYEKMFLSGWPEPIV